jgi:hypothetical protein
LFQLRLASFLKKNKVTNQKQKQNQNKKKKKKQKFYLFVSICGCFCFPSCFNLSPLPPLSFHNRDVLLLMLKKEEQQEVGTLVD